MQEHDIEIAGYTVLDVLGKGGMAEVYLAEQHSLKRKVAIKVLLNDADPDFIQRFVNEAHLLASLHHRSIITIFDINQLVDGRHYIAMELLNGGDLAQFQGQISSPKRALYITRQIAEGLQVVHDKGLIHRDIKPANILFRDAKHVVITDFGIAKSVEQNNDLTQMGMVVGSPSYSSPEQAQCQPLDRRTDIYSLGVLLFEMLTGTNPFKADNYAQTVINHVQGPIPTLPNELKRYQSLLARMLAKQPGARFDQCSEIIAAIDALDHTLLQDDTEKTVVHKTVSLPNPASYKRYAVAIGAVLVVVLMVFLAKPMKEQVMAAVYMNKAESRVEEQRLWDGSDDNAASYYQKVLDIQPDNAEASNGLKMIVGHYRQKAREAFVDGNQAEAIAHIKVAIKIDPDNKELPALLKKYTRQARPKSEPANNASNPFKELWEKLKKQ